MKMIKIEIIAYDTEPTAKVILTGDDLNTHREWRTHVHMLDLLTQARKWLVIQMISDPSNYWGPEGTYKVKQ